MDLGPGEQETGLGQAAPALVHGNRSHISPRSHGGNRQSAAEVEMGAMGFVGQAQHPCIVGHLHNGPEVAAHSIIGGIVHHDGYRIRIFPDGPGHLIPFHPQADSQPFVHIRIHIDRDGPAEHQGVDDAFMDVPRQDDLIPPFAGRQNHGLDGAGGPPHHQKSPAGAEGIGGQLFRLPDHRNRMAQVVQGLHAVHIHSHTFFSQELRQFWIAPAPFVAGHIKGHHPHLPEPFQGFIDGCPLLFQPILLFQALSLPSIFYSCTKKRKLPPCSLRYKVSPGISVCFFLGIPVTNDSY